MHFLGCTKTTYMPQLIKKPFTLRCLFTLFVATLAGHAMALQLGRPQIQSKLGEPLKLEVQVSDLSAQEAQDFQANLANATVYQAAKIGRVAGLDNVRITMVRKGDDLYLLQFQGAEAISEPYVDLLLEFRWASGRAYRNLGFPLSNGQAPQPSAVASNDMQEANNLPPLPLDKPAPVAVPPRPAPLPSPTKAEPKPKAEKAVAEKPLVKKSDDSKQGDTIEVVRGDTASKLMMTHSVGGDVSLDQMLMSLLRNNPKAFVDNNVNRLKAGALITLPTEEEAASIDRKQAREDIRLQALDFDAYRTQLAGQVGKSKLADANERESKGGLKAQVDNKAQKSTDQLTLSKPGAGDADKVKQNLETEQAAQRNQEVAKNVTELDALSKAAGKMQDGLTTSMPNLPLGAQDFVAFLKRYMFELIGLIAVIAAVLVSISLLREKRRQQHPSDGDDSDLDFKTGPDLSREKPQDMKVDFDLELPPRPAPSPVVAPPPPAPAAPVNTPFKQTAPATSMPNTAPLSEDPFQVRLDLADELWKLGQRQTGRALAQEVADQTHGETRERALRWLQERA
jgi:FimV-like protein